MDAYLVNGKKIFAVRVCEKLNVKIKLNREIMNKLSILFLVLLALGQTLLAQKSESKTYSFLLSKKNNRTLNNGIKIEKSSDAMTYSMLNIPLGIAKAEPFISFSLRLVGANLDHDALEVSYSENQKEWKVMPPFHENKIGRASCRERVLMPV